MGKQFGVTRLLGMLKLFGRILDVRAALERGNIQEVAFRKGLLSNKYQIDSENSSMIAKLNIIKMTQFIDIRQCTKKSYSIDKNKSLAKYTNH